MGAGEFTPDVEDIDRFLLERVPGEPRVLCMPTAAGREGRESIAYWSKLGEDHFSTLGVRVEAVHVLDREGAMDASLSERISAANFVYLSGGDALQHRVPVRDKSSRDNRVGGDGDLDTGQAAASDHVRKRSRPVAHPHQPR